MKRIFYHFISLVPLICFAQESLYKSSPLEYLSMNVGNASFSAGRTYYINLAFSPNGEPFVASSDGYCSLQSSVMKFDGTNWVHVGDTGFSPGRAEYLSFAFSPSGEPYQAYQDWSYGYRATAMKFDGNNWVIVGNPEVSEYVAASSMTNNNSYSNKY